MFNLQLLKETFDAKMNEGYEPETIAQIVVDKLGNRKPQNEEELLNLIRDAWIEQYRGASTQHISGLQKQYRRKVTVDQDFISDVISAIQQLQSPHESESNINESEHIIVRKYNSTKEAYDATQSDTEVENGDILVIESEGVVGVASTYPFAVTQEYGELHKLSPQKVQAAIGDAKTIDQSLPSHCIQTALDVANKLGLDTIAPQQNSLKLTEILKGIK